MREQQQVVEHHPDRPMLGGRARLRWHVEHHAVEAIVPSAGGEARDDETSVDFPEPFGPSNATVWPAAASKAARTSNVPRC